MPLFVGTELDEFIDKAWGSETRHQNLAGIDADRPMLASMIDLDDPVAEVLRGH